MERVEQQVSTQNRVRGFTSSPVTENKRVFQVQHDVPERQKMNKRGQTASGPRITADCVSKSGPQNSQCALITFEFARIVYVRGCALGRKDVSLP